MLASSKQQPLPFTIDNWAEKNPTETSKIVLLASNTVTQEPFSILLPRYPVMISSPEVQCDALGDLVPFAQLKER